VFQGGDRSQSHSDCWRARTRWQAAWSRREPTTGA